MQDDMDVQQSLATITPSLLHLNKYANHPDLPPNWVEGKRCCPKDCVVQLCFHHTKVVMRIFRLLHPLANAVNSKSLRTSAGGPVPQKSAPRTGVCAFHQYKLQHDGGIVIATATVIEASANAGAGAGEEDASQC